MLFFRSLLLELQSISQFDASTFSPIPWGSSWIPPTNLRFAKVSTFLWLPKEPGILLLKAATQALRSERKLSSQVRKQSMTLDLHADLGLSLHALSSSAMLLKTVPHLKNDDHLTFFFLGLGDKVCVYHEYKSWRQTRSRKYRYSEAQRRNLTRSMEYTTVWITTSTKYSLILRSSLKFANWQFTVSILAWEPLMDRRVWQAIGP